MCGNCCVFPESFFQGNTIQAWGVTAETDWHPEARTNSYSKDHLTPSIKGMSLPKMRVPSGHSPPRTAAPTAQMSPLSCLPLTHKPGQPEPSRPWPLAAVSQEHSARGQQGGGGQSDQGCWAQQSRKWCPSNPLSPTIALGWRMLSLRGMHSCRRGQATKGLPRGHQRPFLGLCALTAQAGVYRSLPSVSDAMLLLRLKFCS